MKQLDRDNEQLGVILRYCQRLDSYLNRFGHSFDAFCADMSFQDSCSLCLVQIGEAVNRLSEEFKEANPCMEWRGIYGMRCHIVHGYDMFDAELVWDAITKEIPPLEEFCKEHFRE